MWCLAMNAKAPVLTTQASADPKVDPQLRELGAETAVWLPVMDSCSVRGVLILARCRPIPFTHAEAGLLSAMAYRIGLALEQAQRKTQLEQISSSQPRDRSPSGRIGRRRRGGAHVPRAHGR